MEDGPAIDNTAPNPAASTELSRLAHRVAELESQVAHLSSLVAGQARIKTAQVVVSPAPPIHRDPPPLPLATIPDGSRSESAPPRPVILPKPEKSLEDRLGSQVFNLIGIVALLFGAAWALKLAIEHGLIGPAERVIIGLVAGAGLIAWSELFRRRNLAAFSYSLKAVGTGVLYLSLWAAFQLFGLVSAPVALAGMILVTAWNAFMALTQDAELLASYALVGALLTPLLLSTGGDHETFLFTYIAAIDLGVVVLQRFKGWPRQLIPSYLVTAGYFIGYYTRFFHPQYPTAAVWDNQSAETALFVLIFFALFALVSTKLWTGEEQPVRGEAAVIVPVLLPLANAAFISLALYSVFQDSGLHDSVAWLMVGLAAVFLGLMRVQRTSMAAAMHLASAIVFLTVAIPLKLSGQWLTTAWLVEGLVLYWAATRVKAENKAPSRVLGILSIAGYMLGLASVLAHWTFRWVFDIQSQFFSANLGTAIVAVAALAGAVWLASRRSDDGASNATIQIAALSAIDAIALLLALRELGFGGGPGLRATAFVSANFATALVGLVLLAGTSAAAWNASRTGRDSDRKLFRITAYVDVILFNLVAILTFEHEIGLLFTNAEADLQRSLALSGFLMLYGAVLLAIGFWRRSAFVRWQALILILFTVAKVFLYDISGLSAGYRVASFMALGALLLTVSYAYQKDWLGLKTPMSEEVQP